MPHWLQNFLLKYLPVSFLRPLGNTGTSSEGLKQLLVDVSVISVSDAGTGIQRVVRNLYRELLAKPPAGYQVLPIAATSKQSYHYLPTDFLEETCKTLDNVISVPVQVNQGDIFLGLDLAAHIIPHRVVELLQWKRKGARLCFFIYDLLPVLEPTWFNPKTTRNFRRWLRALAILADDVITISRAVKLDFEMWMQVNYGIGERELPCATIQLGSDLSANPSGYSSIDAFTLLPAKLFGHNFILMVGTLEPRKGHSDVLDAFEEYWAADGDFKLVIVGKEGWKVEPLMQRIKAHKEMDKRMLWLNKPSDDILIALYQTCSGLLMASKGEGLGLPLIEVACFNKPVLARDIPIFREIAGDNVTFFPNQSAGSLPKMLISWIKALVAGNGQSSVSPHAFTWSESCLQLTKLLSGNDVQDNDIPTGLSTEQELPVSLTKWGLK